MRGFIAIAIGLLGACSELEGHSLGHRGNIEFEISPDTFDDPGDPCFISCAIDRPLLVGTTERIRTSLHDSSGIMPLLVAQSSDPDVLTVESHAYTCCGSGCREGDHYDECLAEGKEARYQFSLTAHAVQQGTSYVQLFTSFGTLFDELPVRVSHAHSIDLQLHEHHDYATIDELRLGGQHREVQAIARDRNGDWMFATQGISMELSANGVAAFYGEDMVTDGSRTEVWPLARGIDMLTIHASGVSTHVPVISE